MDVSPFAWCLARAVLNFSYLVRGPLVNFLLFGSQDNELKLNYEKNSDINRGP